MKTTFKLLILLFLIVFAACREEKKDVEETDVQVEKKEDTEPEVNKISEELDKESQEIENELDELEKL